MASFKKIYKLLSSHERKRAGLLWYDFHYVFVRCNWYSINDAVSFRVANPDVVIQMNFSPLYNHLEFENEQLLFFRFDGFLFLNYVSSV